MKCPKHPTEEMILLLNTWVCDVCDGKEEDCQRDKEWFDKIEILQKVLDARGPSGPLVPLPEMDDYDWIENLRQWKRDQGDED